MKSSHRFVIIMAGGSGERFWPVSRGKKPKQLIKLIGSTSFLQQAVGRLGNLLPMQNILIVTQQSQAREVGRQLPALPKENLIVEPCGRDTCAAIMIGAAVVGARDPKGVMAVLPADHLIEEGAAFRQNLRDCFRLASRYEVLVTLGIKPTHPATGYGYIKAGETLKHEGNVLNCKTSFRSVEQFVEKPSLSRAKKFLLSGQYRWNAGMFVWSLGSLLKAMELHQPHMAESCMAWLQVARSPRKLAKMLHSVYPDLPRISIDFALMEKADNVVMADSVFDWDDLGSWTALERYLVSDPDHNCIQGNCIQVDSSHNIIFDARPKRGTPIALVGIKDCIVVQTEDACMVASKSHAQQIKDLVRKISSLEKFRHLT
ncbi:MAG: sugar phosphate nucleotidyltransferase [Verrucomicrobiota bacterium]|nr:sugar phosphate nucleotidyltransferase [Verrucomicrobiota bacterium]